MTNATTLNIGQVNGAGDRNALFMKLWSGEVLTAFETASVTQDKHYIRSITGGRSASFPATWKVAASMHTPGQEILGQTANTNERVITVDDLLISPVFIPQIDEAMNHYDYRGIYSRETGIALGTQWDKNVLQVGVLAARTATPTVTGAFAGTSLTSLTTLYKTSATDLVAGLYLLAQAYDEKDIPESSTRYVYLRPAQYYLLAQMEKLVDRDFSAGNGDYAKASVRSVANMPLIKCNNLPTTLINTGPAAYQGDFTKTAALVMTKEAVGTVKLMDLQTEMQWDIRRQGTLIVSKYAVGTGILRPECAGELKTTT